MDSWVSFAKTGCPETEATGHWPLHDPLSRQVCVLACCCRWICYCCCCCICCRYCLVAAHIELAASNMMMMTASVALCR